MRRVFAALTGAVMVAAASLVTTASGATAVPRTSLHPEPRHNDFVHVALPAGVGTGDLRARRQGAALHAAADAAVRATATQPFPGMERVDRIVVFTDGARRAIFPDADSVLSQPAAASAGVPSGNNLTFTYNSPDSPWTAAELTILRGMVTAAYPVVRSVEGPPFFAHPVNIRKASINYAGEYNPSTNEITINGSPTIDVLVHEMIHAFRDDYVMAASSFEEGMTRAAEVYVVDQLAGYTPDHHSGTYDVYYDALDDARIGGAYGNFFYGEAALLLLRYQLAGYAWGKAVIEHPNFFASFNGLLYNATLNDPYAPGNESKLIASADTASAGTVEGLPFRTWYGYQGVLDQTPPIGNFLYQRLNQWTVDSFSRDYAGIETMNVSSVVSWTHRDTQHRQIDAGSATTSSYGWVDAQPTGAVGTTLARVEDVVRAARVGGGPDVIDARIRPNLDPNPQAPSVFGVVARDVGGTLTLTPVSPSGSSVTTNIVNEAFSFPSFGSFRGTIRATLTYSDGLTLVRVFTKDSSSYLLQMPQVTNVEAPVADAGPDQIIASGASATLDATGSSDPQREPLTYLWTQLSGEPALIEDQTAARTRITAPRGPASIWLRLTVFNASGTGSTSDIAITVKAPK